MHTTDNEKAVKAYIEHLQEKGFSPKTQQEYARHLYHFINHLSQETLTLQECTYNQVLHWITILKAQSYSTNTINIKLSILRHFYTYLQKEQTKEEPPILNPVHHLELKGKRRPLPNNLLSQSQLETLYTQSPENTLIQQRNKLILSLYIFQGLRLIEIELLELHHLNLKEGTITIPKNTITNRRTLTLEARQILPFHEYLTTIHPQLLQQNHRTTHKLFFNIGKDIPLKDNLRKYLTLLKKIEPTLKNFLHIRTSVIALWAEEKNIREVQYKAGHYTLSTTEDYKKTNMTSLKEALNQYHPQR